MTTGFSHPDGGDELKNVMSRSPVQVRVAAPQHNGGLRTSRKPPFTLVPFPLSLCLF